VITHEKYEELSKILNNMKARSSEQNAAFSLSSLEKCTFAAVFLFYFALDLEEEKGKLNIEPSEVIKIFSLSKNDETNLINPEQIANTIEQLKVLSRH